MLNRRHLTILFLFFLTLFVSCTREKTLTKNTPLETISEEEGTSVVNPEDPAVLCVLKEGDLYMGTLGNTQCVVKVDFSTTEKLSGVFYLVDSNSLFMQAKKFEMTTDGPIYKWKSGGKEFVFDVKYQFNSDEVNGVYQIKHTKRKYEQAELNYFAFQRYEKDENSAVMSYRYQRPIFEVDCEQNVVYGKASGPWTSLPIADEQSYAQALVPYLFKASQQKDLDLTMDIYTPRYDSLTKRPMIMLIHGGAFFFGDKHDAEMIAQCSHWASLGYVAVSINYRMGFELSKSSIQRCGVKAIQDAHAAMRYLVHNANQYGIDVDEMYVGGSSAGSITAMSMVYMTDEKRPKSALKKHFVGKYGSLFNSGNDLKDKVKVKGILNMWGAMYEVDDVAAHPLPIVSFHGTADKVVPCYKGYPFSQLNGKSGKMKLSGLYFDEMYGSSEIHKMLKDKKVHQEFYPLDDMGHAPWKGSDRKLNDVYYFIQNKTTEFLYDDLLYDLKLIKKGVATYLISSPKVKSVQWEIQGGVILSQTPAGVEIRLFRDAPTHSLTATGVLNNDAAFKLKISKFEN